MHLCLRVNTNGNYHKLDDPYRCHWGKNLHKYLSIHIQKEKTIQKMKFIKFNVLLY